MSRQPFKERLGEKFADYPLLRTLLLNPWFALVLIVVLVVGVTLAVCLPKVWVVSPVGFRPVMRVSLLDLVQAKSLRASATRHETAGRHKEAATAWQAAVLNNPADLELYRGMFRQLAEAPRMPLTVASRSLRGVPWILRLGGTNQVDLELLAAAFDTYGLVEDVYGLLSPLEDRLSPPMEAAYLKALFQVGRYEEFGSRWEKMKHLLPQDTALDYCRAAYLAGWGPSSEVAENRAKLQAGLDDVRWGLLTCRLEMAVSSRRLDPDSYQAALQRLQEGSDDRIIDHIRYWQVLLAAGRVSEAQRIAAGFNRPPNSAYEVVQVAEVLVSLDLVKEGLDFYRRHAPEFGFSNNVWSVGVWAAYADLLIAQRQWERLKEVATQMRSIPGGHKALGGFSYFLEGRVAYAQGSVESAKASFKEAVKMGFPLGRVGIRVGAQLLQMNFPELAIEALRPLEPRFEDDLGYWKVVFDASDVLRNDEALLLRAATRAHELAPDSRPWQFNFAAALLIGRRRPEEALRLTVDLIDADGNSLGGRINHAIALALNGRYDDAEKVLNAIPPTQMNEFQRVSYFLAWLDVHHGRRDWEKVRLTLRNIDPASLFPSQKRWLAEVRQSLPQ
jgi:tetratricopeptide (TPR) repeat protein